MGTGTLLISMCVAIDGAIQQLIAPERGTACFSTNFVRDKERAKAESAVTQFHKSHNDRRLDEVYARLDDRTRSATTKEQFMAAANQTFDKMGSISERHSRPS
jgi:hypothetical protein